MTFLYEYPAWLVAGTIIVVMTLLALLGLIGLRRVVPYHHTEPHNDVAGFTVAIVGVIYAVLIAFVVIVVWERYDSAGRTVEVEADSLSDLYRFSRVYPDPVRSGLQAEIFHYLDLMETEEWPAMTRGAESKAARQSAERIVRLTVQLTDDDRNQRIGLDARALAVLQSFFDARRQRLNENKTGLPTALWLALLAGAALTIGFTYLFGVKNLRLHLLMTGLIAAMIAVLFALMVVLDYPYRGDASVSPEPFPLVKVRLGS